VVLLSDHGGKPFDRTALRLLLPNWLLARHPAVGQGPAPAAGRQQGRQISVRTRRRAVRRCDLTAGRTWDPRSARRCGGMPRSG
jgi:hypothetical protein